ncbi:Pyrrolo-quinoline quinone [Methanolacinia petrolearia DSM 11571]|uniref:Pyrrolo-quinoline quinone n=1 Tax=Methanolacinia petrolearia (strain DSM 11571 / OCM 486 / SEBR 4847) TaxID=679926 RepID=E1RJ18_METP4|nr:PQQ-binding-like beta-propeller repeat protein [Methanolacinia petrolearia]ADN36688.1 Pyrrolo-quinoline quinone [Methanolacinia petrolearia DSM 11571]
MKLKKTLKGRILFTNLLIVIVIFLVFTILTHTSNGGTEEKPVDNVSSSNYLTPPWQFKGLQMQSNNLQLFHLTYLAMSDSGEIVVVSGSSQMYSFNVSEGTVQNFSTIEAIECIDVSSGGITVAGSSMIVGNQDHGVVSCFDENGMFLWNYTTGGPVSSIKISSDGRYIVAGTEHNPSGIAKIMFFSVNGSLLWMENAYKSSFEVTSVDITPDGEYVAAGTDYNKVYLFSNNGAKILDYTTYGPIDAGYTYRYRYTNPGQYVALSDDGTYLAAGSLDRYVYMFSNNGTRLWRYKGERPFCVTDITSDGSSIVSVSDDGTIFFFNRTGSLLWTYGTESIIRSIKTDSSGDLIVAGSNNSEIYCLNGSGDLIGNYTTIGGVTDVEVSEDGSYISAISEGGVLYFFGRDDLCNRDTAV